MESKKTIKSKVLSDRIREIRTERDLTLQELADKVNIGIATLQRYETNKTENFKLDIIERIGKALNTSTDYLTGKIDFPNDYEELNPIIYMDNNLTIRSNNFTLNEHLFEGALKDHLMFAEELINQNPEYYIELEHLIDALYHICNFEKNSSEMLLIIDRFYRLTGKERDLIRSICEIPKE